STATLLQSSFPTDTSEFSANIPIIQRPFAPDRHFKMSICQRELHIKAPGVLSKVEADDPDDLKAVLIHRAANGCVKLKKDGSFVYKPHSNFQGIDSFTFIAIDRGVPSNVATVFIKVS